MRAGDQRGVAVFLAAAVLAVTGTGVAVARSGADSADLPVVAAPLGVDVLAAPDLTPSATAPSVPPTAADAPSDAPGTDEVAAPEVDAADDVEVLDPGAGSATEDVPADDPAADADAGADEPTEDEELDAAPAAVPLLPGRTADSLLPALDLDAVDATAAATGIPSRALAAYASVGLRIAEEQPGCDLGWVTLAAIGWVESHHGSIGGRTLTAEGRPDRTIVGVPLDGGPGVRAIRDSDGGRWDGDATWDRAVGPMQFIPSTWRRWQVDASGTGTADPQHIDDAALAAGRYLCAAGGGSLAQPEAWYRAVFAYNNSDDYVRAVLDIANTYAERANG